MVKKSLWIPLASIFLDILGFSFILPIVPFIVKGFGGDSLSAGITISAAAIGMFIGGAIFGRLSDSYGRKRILLLTILLNIVGYIVFSLSGNLPVFFLARFLCGLGGGGASVVQAYISDISSEEDRIVNMGYVGVGIGLGFTLGPIIGSLLSSLSLMDMGLVSAIPLTVSFVMVAIFMEDAKARYMEGPLSLKGSSQGMLFLYCVYFVNILTFAGMQTIFGLYLNSVFGVSARNIGYVFGYLGIVTIIYQALFIRHTYRLLGDKRMVTFGIALMGGGLILLGSNTVFPLIYAILLPIGIGMSNINSAIFSLIIKHSHKKDFGKNLGINTSFGSAADSVGPIIGGFLFLKGSDLPFFVFGIALIGVAVFFQIVFKPFKH